jgi:hypothetical protein
MVAATGWHSHGAIENICTHMTVVRLLTFQNNNQAQLS